jgi:nitrogenase-stabilizing/protective protein
VTTLLDQMRRLSAAEEFFQLLDVPYEQGIVNVARLHILRRMGQYLRGDNLDGLSEDEQRAACREHLATAYSDFVRSSPIQERVFKVHQEAVAPKAPPKPAGVFVPLSAVTGPAAKS